MAVHRKFDALSDLHPHVAIIPECANVETLSRKARRHLPDMVWIGEQADKGLGIFGFGDYAVELLSAYDPRLEWIAPVKVTGPHSFLLLGAWCKRNARSPTRPWRSYRQVLAALELYGELIRAGPTVVAGDFNTNATWDKPGRSNNFAATVDAAEAAGLLSAYHAFNAAEYGAEREKTLYWRDRTERGPRFHVDFCFIPREWIPHVTSVTVGDFARWVGPGLSDHVPLVVEVAVPD